MIQLRYYFSRKQRDEQRARDVRVIKYPGYIDYTVIKINK